MLAYLRDPWPAKEKGLINHPKRAARYCNAFSAGSYSTQELKICQVLIEPSSHLCYSYISHRENRLDHPHNANLLVMPQETEGFLEH